MAILANYGIILVDLRGEKNLNVILSVTLIFGVVEFPYLLFFYCSSSPPPHDF